MRKTIVMLVSLPLTACATLQGRPTPVADMGELGSVVRDLYSPAEAVRAFNGEFCTGDPAVGDGSTVTLSQTTKLFGGFKVVSSEQSVPRRCIDSVAKKRSYRDEVLFTYLAAIDARYRNFISGITSQRKAGNSQLSLMALYTSALASVASGGLATGFSASSTFLQGAQGKLNKDLFYEQTMPSLIALMDAERANIRASILKKLVSDRNSGNITYSMAEALMDIGRYEDAASIEKAVAALSQQASQALEVAKKVEGTVEDERNTVDKKEDNLIGGKPDVTIKAADG